MGRILMHIITKGRATNVFDMFDSSLATGVSDKFDSSKKVRKFALVDPKKYRVIENIIHLYKGQ